MGAYGPYATIVSYSLELLNLLGRKPSLLPGARIFRKYLQGRASVGLRGQQGLLQSPCNGKMGAKKDVLFLLIPSFLLCGQHTCAFGQKEYPHNLCSKGRATPIIRHL